MRLADEEIPTLAQLLGLPGEQQRRRLGALADRKPALAALLDEAEQLLASDVNRGLEAIAVLSAFVDDERDAVLQARVRRAHARALAIANRFEDAIAVARRSVDAALEAGKPVDAARAKMVMLHATARMGRYEEAINCGQEARQTFLDAGETILAAKADANLGETHRLANDPATALACFDRAREVLGVEPVMAAPLENNRAQALLDLNRFRQAEEGFERARRAFESAGMNLGAAIAEGNLADLMARQGRIQRSLYHFEAARSFFERDGGPGDLARLETEHAEALMLAGSVADAAEIYRWALPELRRHDLAVETARAGIGLARALIRLRRFEEAQGVLWQAVADYESLGHEAGVGMARFAEGELALVRQRPNQARIPLTVALSLLEDRAAEAAMVRRALAETLMATGAHGEEADEMLGRAIVVADALDLAPLLADLYQSRARLRTLQAHAELAMSDLRAAIRQIERIRGSLQAERFRATFLGARASAYEDLVSILIESRSRDDIAEAFATVEQAKSRSLLDLVAGAVDFSSLVPDETADPAAAALVAQIAAARHELNALYSRLPELPTPSGADERARTWRERVHSAERGLQRLENRLSTTHGVGGVFAPPIDLPGVQLRLDPGTTLVEYCFAHDELVAFVATHDRCSLVRGLTTAQTAREHAERLQFQIGRSIGAGERARTDPRLVRDAQRELNDLHGMLVAPLLEHLSGTSSILFVPHGVLHGLPFHALYDGERHLIERFDISYLPSASLLRHLDRAGGAESGDRKEKGAFVIGMADEMAPQIRNELTEVAKTLRGARVLANEDATCAALAEAGPRARLIHLACHGRFSASSPLASGLHLADRWLTVRELYGLNFDGAVVVLSGCDTGRCALDLGDELIGLERGFFAAGASALALSLWPLHDESATETMSLAYKLWEESDAANSAGFRLALAQAQRTMLEKCPNPTFWAPIVYVGRP